MTEITVQSRELPADRREVHSPLGRHGRAVGGQSLGRPDPRPALSVRAAADRRGDRRNARHGPLQRLEQPSRIARLEADPPGAVARRPARSLSRPRPICGRWSPGSPRAARSASSTPPPPRFAPAWPKRRATPGSARSRARRLAEMEGFVATVDRWYDQMLSIPAPKIMALMRMGSRVASLVGLGRRETKER